MQQIAEDKGFTVHLLNVVKGIMSTVLYQLRQSLSITAIVKYLKGITGRKLFERFPEIRNQLWRRAVNIYM